MFAMATANGRGVQPTRPARRPSASATPPTPKPSRPALWRGTGYPSPCVSLRAQVQHRMSGQSSRIPPSHVAHSSATSAAQRVAADGRRCYELAQATARGRSRATPARCDHQHGLRVGSVPLVAASGARA